MEASRFSLLIQEVVIRDPASVRQLARRTGKTYATLLREADPGDAGAKLGVDTLLRIMQETGDVRPLQYMAECMDMTLEPRTDAEAAVSGGRHAGQ